MDITIEQSLDITSGLRGAADGGIGMGVPFGEGEFEYALGVSPNCNGKMCDLLQKPNTNFDYSDANYSLLALTFQFIVGEDLRDYLKRKLFDLMGIGSVFCDVQGGYGKLVLIPKDIQVCI